MSSLDQSDNALLGLSVTGLIITASLESAGGSETTQMPLRRNVTHQQSKSTRLRSSVHRLTDGARRHRRSHATAGHCPARDLVARSQPEIAITCRVVGLRTRECAGDIRRSELSSVLAFVAVQRLEWLDLQALEGWQVHAARFAITVFAFGLAMSDFKWLMPIDEREAASNQTTLREDVTTRPRQ
jgi:hypothetical protein